MLGLNALDRLASGRRDGLIPEMRDLLGRLAAVNSGDNVTELASYRSDAVIQAGPNPTGAHAWPAKEL